MDYNAHITRPEDQVNNMDITQISRIDTAKFFESSNLKELNNSLISICKQVFIEAYNNNGKEAGAVLDINNLVYGYKKATRYFSVSFDDNETTDDNDCYKILSEAKECSCIAIHTHNDTSYFSVSDIMSLIKDRKVIAIVVITSKADIFVLCAKRIKRYTAVENYINNMFEDFITPELREIMEEHGLLIRRITQ